MEELEDHQEGEPAPAVTPRRAGRRTAAAGKRTGGRAAGRAGATRRRAVEAPSKGGPNPMIFVGVGVVVVAAAAFFFLRDSNSGGDGGSAEGQAVASTTGGDSGAAAGTTASGGAGSTGGSAKEVYAERLAALGDADVQGRLSLASFCDEQSWGGSARQLRREALLIDPDQTETRQAFGFVRYDGPATKYRGRWLSESDLARVKELEKFETGDLGAAATSQDVFMRAAQSKTKTLSREFPPEKWNYCFGPGSMKQPFLVLVEKSGDANVEEHRKEYDDLLTTLYDAFFERYRVQFSLEEIESPAVVIIWESEATYSSFITEHPDDNYTPPGSVRGYYQPWSQRLILWRQDGLRNVLLHEGSHMLIHYAFSGRGFVASNESPWFQEGFAEFFGGSKVEIVGGKKKYILGQRLPGRESELAMLQNFGKRLPVFDLIKLSSYEFEESKKVMSDPSKTREEQFEAQFVVSNVYAQGWALIMYLNHADGGKYRPAFDAYFKAETEGGGHWETMGELLGLDDEEAWAEFDTRFHTWTQTTLRKL